MRDIRAFRDADAVEHRFHISGESPVISEGVDLNRAVKESSGHGVVDTEFPCEAGFRAGSISGFTILSDENVDCFDVCRIDIVFAPDF